ncbi:MAG: Response regulator PleD [Chromatiales bacterium USCg_Taylor]|nr:MAG: Response regulator PleD [Chromatiales bacterium USCg_Taylor]
MTANDTPEPGVEAGAAPEGGAAIPEPQATSHLRHELRTPINHIIGYSELLLEEADDSALQPFTGDLQKIHTAGKTLLGMLNALFESPTLTAASPSPGELSWLNDKDTDTEAVTADREATALLPGHLLVVDDNETNRDMLSRRLRHQGYRVSMAKDGRRALQAVRDQPVDLVLLDVLMPEMDGYETLKQLKADARLRDIPVIMISALDEIQSVVRCIEHGAEDYLPKPFNPVLLRARIGACLEKKRLRDQEVLYLQDVARVTTAAAAVESGQFVADTLAEVGKRPDELGQLARVFQRMAQEVAAREQRFKQQIETLRIEIDETKKARQVAELTETDFFQKLQEQARTRPRSKK